MSWLKHQRVRCNRIIRFHRYKLLRDPRRFDSAHDHDSYFHNYKYNARKLRNVRRWVISLLLIISPTSCSDAARGHGEARFATFHFHCV
nr:MAG TPA: hypothetical protein [Caudoviricetes sp.]